MHCTFVDTILLLLVYKSGLDIFRHHFDQGESFVVTNCRWSSSNSSSSRQKQSSWVTGGPAELPMQLLQLRQRTRRIPKTRRNCTRSQLQTLTNLGDTLQRCKPDA